MNIGTERPTAVNFFGPLKLEFDKLSPPVLLQEISCAEEREKQQEAAVDKDRLLARRHAVGAETVALVLCKARNFLGLVLKGPLLRSTDWALPVAWQVLRHTRL